jgi:Amt family ammonium transporter
MTAASMMGARLGRWDIKGDPPMGSPTNAVIGLFMLWWGWLAFNAGSTFGNEQILVCIYSIYQDFSTN